MKTSAHLERPPESTAVKLIAVGVDGKAEGRDAAVLGATIARATDGQLTLVAVHPPSLFGLPPELNWKGMHEQANAVLRELRDDVAPNALTVVETDLSVARGLERVVRQEHRDLLVVGSSPNAPEGHVRIGSHTRQLLGDARCALAVAPRGFGAGAQQRIATIGVGYDGGQESRNALAWAGALAHVAGAKLRIRAVVNDRPPPVGWWEPRQKHLRDQSVDAAMESLRELAEQDGGATGAEVEVEVQSGSASAALKQLSQEVDLLVIGSRRWGAVARVLLGSTGEKLMHDAGCAVMVVPRVEA